MMEASLQGDDAGAIRLSGSVTFDNLATLRAQGARIIEDAAESPVFSLGGLEEGNSAAVALLMGWFRQAHRLGKALMFVDVPENLRNIIEVSGLTEVLPLEPGVGERDLPAPFPGAEPGAETAPSKTDPSAHP